MKVDQPDPRPTKASAREKYERVLSRLAGLDSVLVAYSGGVDSTLLAVAAKTALGPRAVAVLAASELHPHDETELAVRIAEHLGLQLTVIDVEPLSRPGVSENPPDRCYHCKLDLFGRLSAIAAERGLAALADGANADDAHDYRPGSRATAELGVVSPLAEAGMTKADIREVARELALPNWDTPSLACLGSRFPYGTSLTTESLARVGAAETRLRALGMPGARVRVHGDAARVEVPPAEIDDAWQRRADIIAACREAGFAYVALDLEGYRTGSMNEVLPRG